MFAALPLISVVCVNLVMALFVLPHLDVSFLAQERWRSTSLSAVGGVWAVVVALAAAIVTLICVNYKRLPALRESLGAGANASVLPAISIASLVGFGAVVAALPGFPWCVIGCYRSREARWSPLLYQRTFSPLLPAPPRAD